MQDVSPSFLHGVADLFSGLSMGVRQICDEFLAQEGDLAWGNRDVFKRQFIDDLLNTQAPDKQGPAHMDNDIEAEGAPIRRESSERLGAVDLIVTGALQAGFLCREGADVQSDDTLRLRFLCLQLCFANRAYFNIGIEVNRRCLGKEPPGVYTGDQLVDGRLKKLQRFERGVFFPRSCCRK